MRPRSRTAGPHRAGNTHSTLRPHTPTRTHPARPFVPAMAQTCHSHEHLPAKTIAYHRRTVTVPAPFLLRPIGPAEGPIRATLKLHERGPPHSLANDGLAPSSEYLARRSAHPPSTAPSREPGRIWHIPGRSSTRDQPPGAGRAGGTAGPADHLRRRRAQGSCGLIGRPGQHVRDVRSHLLIKVTFPGRAGTDPAGPLHRKGQSSGRIASATSAERPQHSDRLAAGHGHSGAEPPRRHYSLRCWPDLTAPAPAVPGRLLC